MTKCPYILPVDKRPKNEIQAPAYAYPNANTRIVISDTGTISVGSGDSYNIDSKVYTSVMYAVR